VVVTIIGQDTARPSAAKLETRHVLMSKATLPTARTSNLEDALALKDKRNVSRAMVVLDTVPLFAATIIHKKLVTLRIGYLYHVQTLLKEVALATMEKSSVVALIIGRGIVPPFVVIPLPKKRATTRMVKLLTAPFIQTEAVPARTGR